MMNKYVGYLDSISVEAEQHERTMKRLYQKPTPLYQNRTVLRYTGMAACAAVLMLCVLTIPGLFNKPVANTPYDLSNTSIIGLPVENFNLAELHNSGGEAASRIGFVRMSDFFSFSKPYFAFVRVIETEEWTDKSSFTQSQKQTSTVQILSTLWSETELPEIMSVTQSKYGGCCAGEETNLIRDGGVYLLPMIYWENGDTWIVSGDLDVLFEVDDQGRIWSHSQHEGFNQFDGLEASIVVDVLTAMTADENFSAVITRFGYIANSWGVLAEVTVMGTAHDSERWEWEQNLLVMSVDNVLSIAQNDRYTWRPKNNDEIQAVSNCYLEQGARYLILFDPSDGGPYIEEGRVAIINADGTITAISDESVFAEFNGYTVEHMKFEAERSIAWHRSHVK
jgi:hypothetical protein